MATGGVTDRLTGDTEKESAQSAVVIGSSGSACGTLVKEGATVKLKVGDATSVIGPDARISLVTTCPKIVAASLHGDPSLDPEALAEVADARRR